MTITQDKPVSIRDVGFEHQEMIETFKNSLLLVLLARLGGKVEIPVATVDDFPRGRALAMAVRDRTFILEMVEGPNIAMPADKA